MKLYQPQTPKKTKKTKKERKKKDKKQASKKKKSQSHVFPTSVAKDKNLQART